MGGIEFDDIDATETEVKLCDGTLCESDEARAKGGVGDIDRGGTMLEVETPIARTALFAIDKAGFVVEHDDAVFAPDVIERAEAGGFGVGKGGGKSDGKLIDRGDVCDSPPSEAVVWLNHNVLVVIGKVAFEIGQGVIALGKIKVIVERVDDGMVDNRNVGGAQSLKSGKFVGGDGAGRLGIEREGVVKHVADFAVLLKTKKPATRENADVYSLLFANIEDNLAAHKAIIPDFRH